MLDRAGFDEIQISRGQVGNLPSASEPGDERIRVAPDRAEYEVAAPGDRRGASEMAEIARLTIDHGNRTRCELLGESFLAAGLGTGSEHTEDRHIRMQSGRHLDHAGLVACMDGL